MSSAPVHLELTEQERGFLFGVCFTQMRLAKTALVIIDPTLRPSEHDLAARNFALFELILRKLSDAR